MSKWYKPVEWQLCIKKQGIMWPGSLNIPRRAHTQRRNWQQGKEEEEEEEQAAGRDREERGERTMAASLFLSCSLSPRELCSYIILPRYLMSQASPPWHLRLARQPLLRGGSTLTHTQTHIHTHYAGHHRSSQQLGICKCIFIAVVGRPSCGLSVFARQFQTRQVPSPYKYMRPPEGCWWIWGQTPCAPSESLVITDASLFMTADKIALFAAFFFFLQLHT